MSAVALAGASADAVAMGRPVPPATPLAVQRELRPAVWPRPSSSPARLLHVDPATGTIADRLLRDLPTLLRPRDLVVVNDAATLPASLQGATPQGAVEVRLAGAARGGAEWWAVLFGAGSWRERTEDRRPPPDLPVGTRIAFAAGLEAAVVQLSPESRRLVRLSFTPCGAAFWPALYRAGRPVQYSYLAGPLELWHVQSPFAARPWAVEPPSAGLSLSLELIEALRRRGVRLARLTHAAGLSATGDPRIDALLPMPERYDVPAETAAAVEATRAAGGRVLAVGTTVVRALEGAAAANAGRLHAGAGVTDLRLGAASRPRLVSGVVTGIHEPGSSHHALTTSFAPLELLEAAFHHAVSRGYLGHEFGDLSLVLAA